MYTFKTVRGIISHPVQFHCPY